MGLNVQQGVITATGPPANGATTVTSLPSDFDLKAVYLWTAHQTAAGITGGAAAHGKFSHGLATFDGGAVQQCHVSVHSVDDGTNTDTAAGASTDAVLKGYSAATPTVDFEADITAWDGGSGTNSFTITWTDAPPTAIKIHYLALGGSDITGARVFSFTAATGVAPYTQDVTVNAGFGQPDLCLLMTRGSTTTGDAAANAQSNLMAFKSDTERRYAGFLDWDAQGTVTALAAQRNAAVVHLNTTGSVPAIYGLADVTSKASWPTDGFQLNWTTAANAAVVFFGLALKGTFASAIGSSTVPTAAAPQTQDHALGQTPKGALFWGVPIATNATFDTAHADLGGFMVGASDFTNEGCAGWTQDDNIGTATTAREHSETKAISYWAPAVTPTVSSEANASVNGTNVRLSWNDTDTVAREYSYLLLGETAAAAAEVPLLVMAPQRGGMR